MHCKSPLRVATSTVPGRRSKSEHGKKGFRAYLHAVNINNKVLHGCLGSPLPVLTHTYTEVCVDGNWLSLDSYIVDRELFARAKDRLRTEGRRMGYGIHVDGTCEWDGRIHAFSQFAAPQEMLTEDLGRIGEAADAVGGSDVSGIAGGSGSGGNGGAVRGAGTNGGCGGYGRDCHADTAAVRDLERHPRFANRVDPLPLKTVLAPLRLVPGWSSRVLSSRILAVRRGQV